MTRRRICACAFHRTVCSIVEPISSACRRCPVPSTEKLCAKVSTHAAGKTASRAAGSRTSPNGWTRLWAAPRRSSRPGEGSFSAKRSPAIRRETPWAKAACQAFIHRKRAARPSDSAGARLRANALPAMSVQKATAASKNGSVPTQ